MRRLMLLAAALVAATALAAGFASSAGAYGGGAGHDTWQIGVSFNCDNPSYCGADELGGFWGWVEFDRYSDGSITGDAELTGCGHSPGDSGAGHISIDITAAHIGPGGPDDPPGVNVFYIDHNVVTETFRGQKQTTVDSSEFLGDSGFVADAGHYSLHPAPGVALMEQVSYRPAR
jgi:hypothetical protein